MTCPHCNYEAKAMLDGGRGAFYQTNVDFKRTNDNFYGSCNVKIYSCPSCKKVFIS